MSFKASIYNISIKLVGRRALLFNSLSRSLVLLEEDEAALLERVPEMSAGQARDLVRPLIEQGFVVPEEIDELAIVCQRYQEQRSDPGTLTLTLCPTLACNFGCDYCFQGSDKSVQKMSQDVQEGIVRLYRRLLDELPDVHTLRVVWYGGEPLLKPGIIYELSDTFIEINRQRHINYTASMISNGSKMTRAVAEKLYARGLRGVQITLDGARNEHDARRHYLSYKGSYDKIIANIKEWIFDFPIHVDLRVNIDERNKDGIKGLIDDLAAEGLANQPNLKMYFAPVESITLGCHSIADQMLNKVQYGTLEADLIRHAFENGLADLPYPPSFMGLCSALKPNDYIVVPNGDIHKCWDTVSFGDKRIGSIDEIDALFRDKSLPQMQWERFDPFAHATCSSCKILPNCSSFCAHKFVNAEDTMGEAALPCPSLKYSINEKIVLRAEKEGYITSNDFLPDMIRTNPATLCSETFNKEDYIGKVVHIAQA